MPRLLTFALFSMLLLSLSHLLGCGNEPEESPGSNTELELPDIDASTPPIVPADREPNDDPDSISDSGSSQTGTRVDAPSTLERSSGDLADSSVYIVILKADTNEVQQLIRELQQVLPQTQVVEQVQSPDAREMKLKVSNVVDIRALANKIPFASVQVVDVQTRTITVDFDS